MPRHQRQLLVLADNQLSHIVHAAFAMTPEPVAIVIS